MLVRNFNIKDSDVLIAESTAPSAVSPRARNPCLTGKVQAKHRPVKQTKEKQLYRDRAKIIVLTTKKLNIRG